VCVALPVSFKTYPTAGDAAFSLALLLAHVPTVGVKARHLYVKLWVLSLSPVLVTLMWFLWIYPGSGNANFFYNQTLAWLLVNGIVLLEAIGAVRRLDASNVVSIDAVVAVVSL
jgi:phosphatidylinositol glycan class U